MSATSVVAARALARAVHRGDDEAVQQILRRPDLPAIAATLAGWAPTHRRRAHPPDRDLFWPEDQVRPHGTHAAFNRHKGRGETPCGDCVDGERKYQREVKTARRSNGRRTAVPPLRIPGFPEAYPGDKGSVDEVDLAAVDRFLNGDNDIRLNKHERFEVFCRLMRRGTPGKHVARRLRLSGSTYCLYRKRYEEREQVSA